MRNSFTYQNGDLLILVFILLFSSFICEKSTSFTRVFKKKKNCDLDFMSSCSFISSEYVFAI